MSSTITETKEDPTAAPKPNDPPPKKTKKKKKKNTILYQETAVKYYDGFMRNKRYNKGINLSTSCAIFKTAWELPENNGLILPSRVLRHFKQVLPKKPKQNKNKKKKAKTKPKPNTTNSNTNTNTTDTIATTTNDHDHDHDDENENKELIRSRTMMEMKGINPSTLNIANDLTHMQQFRRTMVAGTGITTTNKSLLFKPTKVFHDKIEIVIDQKLDIDENSPTKQREHIISKSSGNLQSQLQFNIETEPIHTNMKLNALTTSDTPITPDVITYNDHADITMDDMKPDVEETPMLAMRAETDIKHMHPDLISFKVEIMKEEKKEEKKNDIIDIIVVKKKKKKKRQILYAEDATKLFKKINDGKRLKNGITLKKACNIFSVAWELPEENGRILPSKVARHFKQVLPSKKNKKKSKGKNIKPSAIIKSRTNRDNVSGMDENKCNMLSIKPQTMRGHSKPNWNGNDNANSGHNIIRSSYQIALPTNFVTEKPKKSIIAHLESLISADPNRSNSNDNEKHIYKNKRKKAGSLTDLDLDIHKINDLKGAHDMNEEDHDQIVENEIEELIKQKKKAKEKEMDLINAIDAGLGF